MAAAGQAGRGTLTRIGRAAAALALASVPVAAQDTAGPPAPRAPSLNGYGVTGLIDMPSGEAQPDGELSVSTAHFGPVSRTTLSFQITPRLSGSFRFYGVRDWNRAFCPPDCDGANQFPTYYDRSFDLRYQVLTEGRWRPAVTVGLQDFAGTGLLAGEFVAATKTLAPGLKATLGLGWGRLGSYNDIGSPFGARPAIDVGFGGKLNPDTWFRGPMAPFGGIEWQAGDRLRFKAEYSSDAYAEEAGLRGTFRRRSPMNFGIEYAASPNIWLGAYYMYGSQFGIGGHLTLNPASRPGGGIADDAPRPVVPRASAGALGWSTDWVADSAQREAQSARLIRLLAEEGLRMEGYAPGATRAELRIRNLRHDAAAQAVGRAARIMSRVLPPSVETFDIVLVEAGIPASRVSLRRSDLERFEFAPDGAAALRARAVIDAPGPAPAGMVRDPALYPKLTWSVGPYARLRLFDQRDPFKADVGIRGKLRWEIAPGLTLDGSVTQRIAGNLDDRPPIPVRGSLQPVRSALYWYDAEGSTAVERLTLSWNTRLGSDLYGRVTAGWLERMFGGVAGEVLWKPVGSRFALGAEVAYVAQRNPNGGFGFDLPVEIYDTDGGNPGGPDSYRIATGHVSAYYELGNGFHVQLDVGRYLAGDVGATLSIDREFENGWRVGAFATKTNASAEDFGSGSFDKGIRVEVPMAWFRGQPTRARTTTVLRPFRRDGGARLELDGRLYETVRGQHAGALDARWGRVLK